MSAPRRHCHTRIVSNVDGCDCVDIHGDVFQGDREEMKTPSCAQQGPLGFGAITAPPGRPDEHGETPGPQVTD